MQLGSVLDEAPESLRARLLTLQEEARSTLDEVGTLAWQLRPALLHSGARNVELAVKVDQSRLSLLVADDGRGLEGSEDIDGWLTVATWRP
jgi:signal transduction histidine kinase